MFIFLSQAVSGSTGGQGTSALFLLILIAAIVGSFALQSGIRRLRARKTEAVVHDAFHEFAFVALMNAARLDGRVTDEMDHSWPPLLTVNCYDHGTPRI